MIAFMYQQTKILKVRIKDKHRAMLERMAFEVNQIWNAVNEETRLWCTDPIPEVGFIRNNISAFDLQKQLKGIKENRDFIIPAATVQETIAEHSRKRKQHKKDKLIGIREWSCTECGTTHDRDINAAKNILRLGHQTLVGGIPFL